MVATHASKEVVWLQILCLGIGFIQKGVRLDCDSQSAIFLAKNRDYHAKTKHIDVIRGNLGSKMGLIRKHGKISFCELEFKNQ